MIKNTIVLLVTDQMNQNLFLWADLSPGDITGLLSHKENISVKTMPLEPPILNSKSVVLHKRGIQFFLFLILNIDFGYFFEQPHRGGSIKYPQSIKYQIFSTENFNKNEYDILKKDLFRIIFHLQCDFNSRVLYKTAYM